MLTGLLLVGLLAAQDTPALPASFQRSVIESCTPDTLDAAIACLRASVSADDFAILKDRIPARRFRPNLDCALLAAWKLDDPASPMGEVMDRLLGLHRPLHAAGMIISELQVRATSDDHHGIPFDAIRARVVANPPPQSITQCAHFQS